MKISAKQYYEDLRNLRARDREQGEYISDLRSRVEILEKDDAVDDAITAAGDKRRENVINWRKWGLPVLITLGNLAIMILTYIRK